MNQDAYQALLRFETTPQALQASCDYLAEKLRGFLSAQEPVLICFPDEGEDSVGGMFGKVVRSCGAEPLFWGPNFRWKELLRIAFSTHANTIIAHPMVVLGLMKLANATQTPLYLYDVVLVGYPYARWMVEGIKKGLDCRVWGCYAIRSGPVILGFTCDQEAGIHIRDDIFDAMLLDEAGEPVEEPGRGRLLLRHKAAPDVIYDPEETSMLRYQPCSCGCDSPRLVETLYTGQSNLTKALLEDRFLQWSSVLDYRAKRTECGVDMELVVFPGESLPKLPTCARLRVRPWEPDTEIPFYMVDHFINTSENRW